VLLCVLNSDDPCKALIPCLGKHQIVMVRLRTGSWCLGQKDVSKRLQLFAGAAGLLSMAVLGLTVKERRSLTRSDRDRRSPSWLRGLRYSTVRTWLRLLGL